MTKNVVVIDTRAGNLFSLRAAIERLGYSVSVLQKPDGKNYDAVVIPGQGRFGTVLKNLREAQWEVFLESARFDRKPILGICVGMQIFFEASDEDPDVRGFDWFKGKAQALAFPKKPMVGWAQLDSKTWPDSDVYFVNSYAIKESIYSIAETTYGETFCAAIRKDNFTGVQFHPEKSSQQGAAIIRDALNNQIQENR